MERRMDQITNAEEEIAASIDFTNIRFYRALKRSADEEQDDLINNGGWERWEDSTNQEKLAEFSAVCFLYAREITQRIGNKVIMKKREASYFAVWKVHHAQNRESLIQLFYLQPFGLIGSYWGGTRVEAWSPPEALEECNIGPSDPEEYDKHQNSVLFNALVHPFMKMGIKAVLWYQGKDCIIEYYPYFSIRTEINIF